MSQRTARAPLAILALVLAVNHHSLLSFFPEYLAIGDSKSPFGRGGGGFRTGVISCCLSVYSSTSRVSSGLAGHSGQREV